METLKIQKAGKSQYGFYLQLEDGKYKGCSEEVSNFLKDKTPAEIQVEAKEGEGKYEKIVRVKVISSTPSKGFGNKNEAMTAEERKETRLLVDCGNILQRATELTIAVINNSKEPQTASKVLDNCADECVRQFKRIKNSLENVEGETPSQSSYPKEVEVIKI